MNDRDIIAAHYQAIGARGGKARAESLSAKRRTAIARIAGRARWDRWLRAQSPAEQARILEQRAKRARKKGTA